MASFRRGRAKSIAVLAAALGTLALGASPALPDGSGTPETTEAEFGSARLRDDLAGDLTDAAKEVRITFRALSQNTSRAKLTATLDRDRRTSATGATGLSLTLCDSNGVDLGVDGSRFDVSTATIVRWKQFPIPATGDYVLIVRAATAGTWRLTLDGTHGTLTRQDTSPGLPAGATDDIEFEALAGAHASWTLDRVGPGPKFIGKAVQIDQPDLTPLDGVKETATGRVRIDQDGLHKFVYRNAGTAANSGAHVKIVVTPPAVVRRTIYVNATGNVFVPVVTRVSPGRAYFKESALAVTLTGRDFQDGADVRLMRKNFDDIIATDIEVVSPTRIRCIVDLDTEATHGAKSVGVWKVGVWNAPVYGVPDDRSTLVKSSRTKHVQKTFQSLAAGSIRLPQGVVKGTELWHIDFNDDFQDDLNRMGLGSVDPQTRGYVRSAVKAYTILFLRDLFRVNETTGATVKDVSVPICFTVEKPGRVAGDPGVDYNRIEVGGEHQLGDPHDVAEPLFWGYADIDTGNAVREDLTVFDAQDNRVGKGARIRVLDPSTGTAAPGFTTAMEPLRTTPLTANDRGYFLRSFFPRDVAQAARYRVIVDQVTRASREIAGIIAHHVGKAMGIEDGVPTGPMANPAFSGVMWPETGSLDFTGPEIATLRANANRSRLPGTSAALRIDYFNLVTSHPFLMEECTTDKLYGGPTEGRFGFVGGRPNAVKSQYKVEFEAISAAPFGLARSLKLSFDGLDGTAPLWVDQTNNVFYYSKAFFRIVVTDKLRGNQRPFVYRLNIVPDVAKLPQPLKQAAINATATVRAP